MKIMTNKDLAAIRQVLEYIRIDAGVAIKLAKQGLVDTNPAFPEEQLRSIIHLASGLEEILK